MKCDTCQRDVKEVLRVVVNKDYDRMLARPIYNCRDCFEQKEQSKLQQQRPADGQGA